MIKYYILDEDRRTIHEVDLMTWAESFDRNNRRMAYTQVYKNAEVSTVFLGIDHRFNLNHGPPVLFETMVFGGALDQLQERYCTADEALAGHENVVERVALAEQEHAKKQVKS